MSYYRVRPLLGDLRGRRVNAASIEDAARLFVTKFHDLAPTSYTQWTNVVVNGRWIVRVEIPPTEPPCSEGGKHTWGGLKYVGYQDGYLITEDCTLCWVRRELNTAATDPETGTRGLLRVSYL